MAARRIGSPHRAGRARSPARTRASRGWSTSRTNARARAWSSSWAGVRVRSIAAKDAPPTGGSPRASRARDAAVGGTSRAPGQAGWASTMIRISVMSSIA